jgi:hypothetical protein
MASGNALNNISGTSNSGATNTFLVTNPSNTASSRANVTASVGGTSSEDASFSSVITGGQTWSWGGDNSDSDAFVISANASLGTANILRATTAGEITNPLQPAFFATISADIVDVTGDGTQYNILWNTEALDQNSDFDTTTGTFTAPVTGVYAFQTCITLAQIGAGHTALILRFIATGFQYRNVNMNPVPIANGGSLSQTISGIFKMTAGDTMNTQVIVSNSTKTVDISWGSASSVQSWFSGVLLC